MSLISHHSSSSLSNTQIMAPVSQKKKSRILLCKQYALCTFLILQIIVDLFDYFLQKKHFFLLRMFQVSQAIYLNLLNAFLWNLCPYMIILDKVPWAKLLNFSIMFKAISEIVSSTGTQPQANTNIKK